MKFNPDRRGDMLLSGAEILIKVLIEQGVDTIFGYPGGAVLNIYDELYKYSDKINHVLTCHEQSAAHAADGYARSTGKVGVCISTSGPGATNLVTGIATAYMDSIPMVAITGNVNMNLLGKDSFQEVDIMGITMPITKHNYIVKDIDDLAGIIKEAFYIAQEGRPGPVLIDIPKDITAAKKNYIPEAAKTMTKTKRSISEKSLRKAAELINESSKPIVFSGGGTIRSNASWEVVQFAEKINAPVTASLMGIGAIPSRHPLYTGMLGMHGTKASNIGVTESDLLIVIGARFSDRVISKPEHIQGVKVLHIDIDPGEIDKNIKVDAHIIGDIKEVMQRLTPLIEKKKNEQWLERINHLKGAKVAVDTASDELRPEYFFEKLYEIVGEDTFISTEVGQHQMWTALHYKFQKPRRYITSGGLGTMGYGLGASIGVQIANPHNRVVNIAGDGSFAMNCNELATIVSNNLPIVIVIMNNNALGMVRQWQRIFYKGRYSNTTLNRKTDFVKLAEAYGAKGLRINIKEDVVPILTEAFESNGPVVIDCIIDQDRSVFPMVAPGAPINQIMTEENIS
jgi:acetolactate synthase-1/2/3 large subunit